MNIWNIINFSDPLTLISDDFAATTVAVLLVGYGAYGATEQLEDGKTGREVPMFRFWDDKSIDKWVRDTFPGVTAEEDGYLAALIAATPKRDIARVLRTYQVCKVEERAAYQKALEAITDPEKKRTYIDWWKDERRSSMNDIAGNAWHIADKLDEAQMKEERESGG